MKLNDILAGKDVAEMSKGFEIADDTVKYHKFFTNAEDPQITEGYIIIQRLPWGRHPENKQIVGAFEPLEKNFLYGVMRKGDDGPFASWLYDDLNMTNCKKLIGQDYRYRSVVEQCAEATKTLKEARGLREYDPDKAMRYAKAADKIIDAAKTTGAYDGKSPEENHAHILAIGPQIKNTISTWESEELRKEAAVVR